MGVVYLITCIENNKKYIGQASNYVSGNRLYGLVGRWKNHVSAAMSKNDKHCRLLHDAIREFGEQKFILYKLIDVPEEDLDKYESLYIKEFNTLAPKGFNLTTGGKHFEASDEVLPRKKLTAEEKAAKEPKSGYMGSVKAPKIRKYEEDKDLPKYISAIRENKEIIGYSISFPIGITIPEDVQEYFRNPEDPEKALNKAIKRLEELKELHKDRDAKIKEYRIKHSHDPVKTIYEKKSNTCPKYVYPNINDQNKIDGYYVEGYPDTIGGTHSKKLFVDLSDNKRNKLAAIRYVKHLEILNEDTQFVGHEDDLDIDISDLTEGEKIRTRKHSNLPPHITYVVSTFAGRECDIIGYKVNNYVMKDGTKKQRKFCNEHITMKEKYIMAITYLRELIEQNKK